MSVVQIYQFCRAFDNVRWSEVYQCYISGGYAFEKIARASYEVPPEIREAVINDDFKLNDNYPPEQDDFALIAREIDNKYSVLAVANRQLDDGGRPTIGYKYFWLEKSSPDIDDGIGTLVYWWLNQNKPKFNMDELDKQLSPSPKIFNVRELYKKLTFEEDQLQDIKRIVEEQNKIPYTFVVTKELWKQRYPEYTKLHYLALCLSVRSNNLNSWAWNVHKIAYPERFLAIFYPTKEEIPSNIHQRNLPPLNLPSPQTHNPNNLNSNPNNSGITATTQNTSPLAKNSGQIAPNNKITTCLIDIAKIFTNQNKLNSKKTEELFGYLKDCSDADLYEIINENMLKNSSYYEIYSQLVYLISPNHRSSQEWLSDMVISLEIETKKTSPFKYLRDKTRNILGLSEDHNQPTIPEFQRILLEASVNYDAQIHQKLENSIYSGISFLLNKLINPEQRINTNEAKVIAQKIDYLLTRSQGIWQEYFQKYAKMIAQVILDQEDEKSIKYPSIISFCKPILDIIPQLKNIHEQNRHDQYGDYKRLAIIFSKTHRKDLAEFLYCMSGTSDDKIPTEIFNSLDLQIRSQIFDAPSQTIFKQTSYNQSNNSHYNDEKDIADIITGFIFFCIGTFIFFYTAKYLKEWLILVRLIVLLVFTIIAINFTGNPFKRINNINKSISFIYIGLAVALLAAGIASNNPIHSPTSAPSTSPATKTIK